MPHSAPNPNPGILLGIDLGGTNIKAIWTDTSGNALHRTTLPSHHSPTDHLWKESTKSLLYDSALRDQIQAVGLAAPGLADGNQITFMPGRLQGLERFDWSAHLGLPVHVLNDAHAALLGESWQGAARQKRNVVLITLGTGVGGALLINGELFRGSIGRAGHLGHISLDPSGSPDIVRTPGSLEDAIGDATVLRRTGFATTRELVEAATGGSREALEHWNRSLRSLAAALTSLINAFDPEIVVIGGGIALAGDALFKPLDILLDEMEWRPAGHRVPIVPATLGEWAGAYGAAAAAKHASRQS